MTGPSSERPRDTVPAEPSRAESPDSEPIPPTKRARSRGQPLGRAIASSLNRFFGLSHEPPLEPFEALREEFEALEFVKAAETDTNLSPAFWAFTESDIRDPDTLRAQLALIEPAAAKFTSTGQLTLRLNDLLLKEPARLAAHLDPFLRTPAAKALLQAAVDFDSYGSQFRIHQPRVNRLLIERAFPDIILGINDRELKRLFVDSLQGRKPRSALCISGGGVRSATFGVGVLGALAEAGWLRRFRYLSTVSGGGYVGSWLSLWMRREEQAELREPVDVPRRIAEPRETFMDPDATPLRQIRLFSSYMSPRLGVVSADSWTLAATVFRNLLMIWAVVVPILLAVFLIPHAIYIVFTAKVAPNGPESITAWIVALLGGLGGVAYVHAHRPTKPDAAGVTLPRSRSQTDFLVNALAPLTLAAAAFSMLWSNLYIQGLWPLEDAGSTTAFVAMGTVGAAVHVGGWFLSGPEARTLRATGEGMIVLITGFAAGVIGHQIMRWIEILAYLTGPIDLPAALGPLVIVTLATPAFLIALTLAGFVYEGANSGNLADDHREWNARYSAWMLLTAAGWLVAFVVSIAIPIAIVELFTAMMTLVGGLTASWLTSLLGKDAETASKAGAGFNYRQVLLAIAAPVGLVLCLVVIGWWDLRLPGRPLMDVLNPDRIGLLVRVLIQAALLFSLGWLAAILIDTNKFSLHAMYRARLVRAYLGGTRRQAARRPDRFTDVDRQDNADMSWLAPTSKSAASPRPFLVVNTTLNLAAGTDLAWRERKGESFAITPLHAGAWRAGFRRVSPKGDSRRLFGGEGGISIGTAMTISGAAASPNMGYHSSPAVTFLMTLFNARLGWWLGNPGWSGAKTFDRSYPKPKFGAIFPIFREMFGRTDDLAPYVYLSDGGHFENIGLYEMVARRCTVMVVVDGTCDPECSLADLGTAISRVRNDFGVPIEFLEDEHLKLDVRARPAELTDQLQGRAWAVAKVRYSAIAPGFADGFLVYVKSGLYEGAPPDVLAYARDHQSFPHDTTADQFFSESQFDAYRALGLQLGKEMVESEGVRKVMKEAGFL